MSECSENNKPPNTRMSFRSTKEMNRQLKEIGKMKNVAASEVIRRSVQQTLQPRITGKDVEIVRTILGEEMTDILALYAKEIEDLSLTIGSYIIPQCLMSVDTIKLFVKAIDGIDTDELLKEMQADAVVILTETGDKACDEGYAEF